MIDNVIFGLNYKALQFVKDNRDKSILVVDVKNFSNIPSYLTFEDNLVQLYYQSAQFRKSLVSHNFNDSQKFYQQISMSHHEKERELKKALLKEFEDLNVRVVTGRVHFLDEHSFELTYLSNREIFKFDKGFNNLNVVEITDRDHAFVFTLDELIHSEHLYRRIAIEAKTLRSLEIAEMYAHFGSEVTLICDRHFFNQIDHLMFRDAIRDSLRESGVTILEKKEIESVIYNQEDVLIKLKSQSNLAFEIIETDDVSEILADILVVEGDRKEVVFENVLHEKLSQTQSNPLNIVYLSQPYVSLEHHRDEKELLVQLEASEIDYFVIRYEEGGGLEVRINPDSLLITSAIFYCYQAIDLGEIIHLMIKNNLNLNDLGDDISTNSIISVLKSIRERV